MEGYYRRHSDDYRNPHEDAIRAAIGAAVPRWDLDCTQVLDLACGSGEVTLALRDLGHTAVMGMDPFTGQAYRLRTGQTARALSFEDIADGALAGEPFTLIVCSYALHLPVRSRLPGLLTQLALLSTDLLVLTPHNRPEVDAQHGWRKEDEFREDRTRVRLYHSLLRQP